MHKSSILSNSFQQVLLERHPILPLGAGLVTVGGCGELGPAPHTS